MKYQKRDLAMIVFGAKSFMRYAGGDGSASVGALRPTTWRSTGEARQRGQRERRERETSRYFGPSSLSLEGYGHPQGLSNSKNI